MTTKKRPLYDPELYLREKYGSKTSREVRVNPGSRIKKTKAPVGKGGR